MATVLLATCHLVIAGENSAPIVVLDGQRLVSEHSMCFDLEPGDKGGLISKVVLGGKETWVQVAEVRLSKASARTCEFEILKVGFGFELHVGMVVRFEPQIPIARPRQGVSPQSPEPDVDDLVAVLEAANHAFDSGDFERAEFFYTRVLEILPGDEFAAGRLIEILRQGASRKSQSPAGRERGERPAQKVPPGNLESMEIAMNSLYREGDYEAAAGYAREILAVEPNHSASRDLFEDILEALASKSWLDGDYRGSVELVRERLTFADEKEGHAIQRNVLSWVRLAAGISEGDTQGIEKDSIPDGNFEEAFEAISSAAVVFPDNDQLTDYRCQLVGVLNRGELGFLTDQVLWAWEQAELGPLVSATRAALQDDDAGQWFCELVREQPALDRPLACDFIAIAASQFGNWGGQGEGTMRAIHLNQLSLSYSQLGLNQKAAEFAEEGISLNSINRRWDFVDENLAIALARAGDWKRAKQIADTSHKWGELARLAVEQNNDEEIRKSLLGLERVCSETANDLERASCDLEKSEVFTLKGERTKALSAVREASGAIRKAPMNQEWAIETNQWLARVAQKLNEEAVARQAVERVMDQAKKERIEHDLIWVAAIAPEVGLIDLGSEARGLVLKFRQKMKPGSEEACEGLRATEAIVRLGLEAEVVSWIRGSRCDEFDSTWAWRSLCDSLVDRGRLADAYGRCSVELSLSGMNLEQRRRLALRIATISTMNQITDLEGVPVEDAIRELAREDITN